MNERDFQIGDRSFKINKMDAFKQFHIVRRLGPILSDIMTAAKDLKGIDDPKLSEEQKLDKVAKLAAPLMKGLSALSDEDANKVMMGLCSCVEVQQSHGNWAFVVKNDQLMFQDLELPVLLQIAGRAFIYNLTGFFATAPRVSHGGA